MVEDGDLIKPRRGRYTLPGGDSNKQREAGRRIVLGTGGPAHEGPITVPDLSPEVARALDQARAQAAGAYLITFTGPHGEIMRARVRIELEQTGPPIEVGVGVASASPEVSPEGA